MRNRASKLLSLLLTLAMVCSLFGTALAVEEAEDLSGSIVILHTNDVHGAISEYAKVAALKADYEAKGAYVLLVDAGDFAQGDATVNISSGATAVELMNMAGYDLAVPGNHEFDFGYDNLKTILADAKFPVLAANVSYQGEAAFEATKVFETEDGVKIGFFGLDTPEAATKVNPAKIQGVSFLAGEELFACAQAQVDALTAAECDYIIGVGHLGIDTESTGNRSIDLLENVTGIDLFIDGHSHSSLEQIVEATNGTGKVGDTILTSTGTKLENVGVVTIKGDEITASTVATETLTAADEAITARAAEIAKEIEDEYGAVFAKSEVLLNGEKAPGNRTQETNMGDLITDALIWGAEREGVEVDAAITNGGGIRAAIQVGDITKKDVNTVLPFGNTLTTVTLSGADLLEALEASTYCTPEAVGGFPQVSGMEFTVDTTVPYAQGDLYPDTTVHAPASIGRVSIQTIGGKEFDPEATYVLATNDFMAAGGDTYYTFANSGTTYDLGIAMDQIVMDYITEELKGVVSAEQYGEPAGRITIVKDILADYTDVTANAWYTNAARYVLENGTMNGTGAGVFAPTGTVTTATVYQTLYNMEGKPAVEEATVTDAADEWYADAINWAASVGLFEGTEFGADAVITRGGIAGIIADYAAYKEIAAPDADGSMEKAPDYASISETDLEGMTFCFYAGVMTGDKAGNLNPAGELTRAEFAQVLMNFGSLTAEEAPATEAAA